MLDIFISTETLVKDTLQLCTTLRTKIPEFDYVLFIPRGGCLPASIIASIFGKPLSTPDLFIEGKCWMSSSISVDNRRDLYNERRYVTCCPIDGKVLLVDDISYNTLGELERSKRIINAKFPSVVCSKVPIYVVERTKKLNDLYYKEISMSHWFEKDLMTRNSQGVIGYDMDGVLCEDWHGFEKEGTDEYTKFLSEATPYLIPHYRIDYVITCRLEQYRQVTEEWLKIHHVKYKRLIMHPATSKFTRGSHSEFKIKMIKTYMPNGIFIESSLNQSKEIKEGAGIQVICIENKELMK